MEMHNVPLPTVKKDVIFLENHGSQSATTEPNLKISSLPWVQLRHLWRFVIFSNNGKIFIEFWERVPTSSSWT